MRIIITGGTGLIGRALSANLVSERLLDLGFEFQFPVAEAALQDLLQ